MDVKIDIKNELFKRQELVLELEWDKNPGFAEVRKQIAEKLGNPEENIDVLKVEGNFGQKRFDVEAYVYDSKEDLDAIKQLSQTKKQRDEVKKSVEEKSVEENIPAEETTTEEKSVEDKSEEGETPVEERPKEEKKAEKEERQGKEESKEN